MSQRRLLQWINALTLKRTCFLLSLWNLSDFSLYPFPIVLFVWHLWRGTLHPLWSIGSFKYWSTVIIRFPAALSSPGSEDIIDSVFQHRMGSLSFDHGPLLNPFQRAHNLWTAGTRTWHSTLCLAWLALGGMTMTLQMPPQDISAFVAAAAQGWPTCRLCPPGPLDRKQGSFLSTLITGNVKKHRLMLESVGY